MWVHQNLFDAEPVGHEAGVLASGATEADQHVSGHVVAALH